MQAVAKALTDALHMLEHATVSIVSALVPEQANSGSLGSMITVTPLC